jgi:hypothetical protein
MSHNNSLNFIMKTLTTTSARSGGFYLNIDSSIIYRISGHLALHVNVKINLDIQPNDKHPLHLGGFVPYTSDFLYEMKADISSSLHVRHLHHLGLEHLAIHCITQFSISLDFALSNSIYFALNTYTHRPNIALIDNQMLVDSLIHWGAEKDNMHDILTW